MSRRKRWWQWEFRESSPRRPGEMRMLRGTITELPDGTVRLDEWFEGKVDNRNGHAAHFRNRRALQRWWSTMCNGYEKGGRWVRPDPNGTEHLR